MQGNDPRWPPVTLLQPLAMDLEIEGAVLRIAPATVADLPQLVALLEELFRLEQDFTPDAARQRRGLELLLGRPEHAVVLTARACGDSLLGMITAQLVVSTAQGAYSAWIEDVVVDRRWRGCGVGRALVEAALRWGRAQGATRAQLLVDTDNRLALAFYAALGWEPTHQIARRVFLEQL
jgi:GNAT superfamily N-acetyltransferase